VSAHDGSDGPARPARPRLLVLNQYYWPGVEATAHLLSELCSALADEFDITVVTGMVPGAGSPGRATRDGVEILRVNSTSFDRSRLSMRAANYLSYLGLSFLEGLRVERPDVVLCMTDPPVIADLALVIARRFDAPLVVVSQDVFPEVAVALKRLDNPAVVGLLRLATRLYLRRADRVVAIGETMRERLREKGADGERIVVIPNWVDTSHLEPRPRDNAWARERDLVGRFVVMHSGNIGHAQDLDALVRAETFLRDLDDLRIVLIGGGARRDELKALARLLATERTLFIGYQPREVLAESLSAADVHVVGLARGLSGYVVPSRLYGILAVGRPVIVAAEADSETAKVVEEVGCGVVVPPGRPELIAAAIRSAHDGELDLEAMGRRGREYVTSEGDRRVAVGRYRRLLREVAS
jgi:putative colanic acid biosynthesis glycosyltransferase WcaI